MQEGNLPQWKSAKSTNARGQNPPMQEGNLPSAITRDYKETNNKRLTNGLTTTTSPTAKTANVVGSCSSSTTAIPVLECGYSNNKINKDSRASPLQDDVQEKQEVSDRIPFSQILEDYNTLCDTTGLRKIKSINGKRKIQVSARFKEYGPSGFLELFKAVSESAFLSGGGERGWKVDFDWLIAPTNMQKVLEGKYSDFQHNVPVQLDLHCDPIQSYKHDNQQQSNHLYKKPERLNPFIENARRAYAKLQSHGQSTDY